MCYPLPIIIGSTLRRRGTTFTTGSDVVSTRDTESYLPSVSTGSASRIARSSEEPAESATVAEPVLESTRDKILKKLGFIHRVRFRRVKSKRTRKSQHGRRSRSRTKRSHAKSKDSIKTQKS